MSGMEIGALLALGGTALGTVGAIQQSQTQSAAMEADARAQERAANEQRAAATREAAARAREARALLSRQQAVAAKSGGGATDPTVLKLMGDVAAEGAYQTAAANYEGEARAAGLLDQAAISRMQSRQARMAGYINAGSTLLSGLSDWSKFRPKASSAFASGVSASSFSPYGSGTTAGWKW